MGYDSASAALFRLQIRGDTTNYPYFYIEGTASSYLGTAISPDTDYWFRYSYTADPDGSGGDPASLTVCVSTDGTTFTDCQTQTADNADATQLDDVRFMNDDSASGQYFYFDTLKQDDEAITNATDSDL